MPYLKYQPEGKRNPFKADSLSIGISRNEDNVIKITKGKTLIFAKVLSFADKKRFLIKLTNESISRLSRFEFLVFVVASCLIVVQSLTTVI